MEQSTITAKGQTTLPKAVREALGVKPGDTVRYRVLGNGDVRIIKPRSAMDLIGMLHRPGQRAFTIEEMDEAIGRAIVERYERASSDRD